MEAQEAPKGYALVDKKLTVPQPAAKGPSVRIAALERTPSGASAQSDSSNPFETDVEAVFSNSSLDKPRGSVILTRKKDCQVWPDKRDWKQRARAGKKNRTSCAFMQRLSRRNRIIAKILIIVFVVGIAVAVGFGVSKPLGAPIWGDNRRQS